MMLTTSADAEHDAHRTRNEQRAADAVIGLQLIKERFRSAAVFACGVGRAFRGVHRFGAVCGIGRIGFIRKGKRRTQRSAE